MLDANLKNQLAGLMTNLVNPVEIVAALDDSTKGKELRGLVEDLQSISDKITVVERVDAGVRVPSMALARAGESARVSFAGVPMGHEFNSLVLALLHTGGHPTKVDAETAAVIAGLDGGEFETYISLSCHNCPDVVQALNVIAVLNPAFRSTMIDGGVFPDEVADRKIMGVPAVFLNGEAFSSGRTTLAEIVAKLDTNAASRDAEKINAKDDFDVLVVGGGPAGASAAIYAARKGIRTGIVAERFGGQVLDTVGIENFISVKATEGPKLVASLEEHVRDYDVDIMNTQRAKALRSVQPGGDSGQLVEIELANGATLRSKSVILATGARWREMNVPGEQEYRGKGVAYCPHCDGPLFKGKRVAVIGGGNSGVEAAIDLAGIVGAVTLIEFDDKLRADEVLQRKLRSLANVTVITSALTTEVKGDGEKVTGLVYKNRQDDSVHTVDLEGIFVQIGLVPNSDWLKGSLELTPRGEIIVDARGQTSVPGVFAAGDVTTSPYKQIIISMGSGATAALGAFDYLIRS